MLFRSRPEDEQVAESDILDENPLNEEVVTPPDILEEFEKIESDFEQTQTEGAN